VFDIVETSGMARPAFSAHLSPAELKELAEAQIAEAMRLETGPERLRVLTVADALNNLAEVKKLLLDYERRLLN
jgi:DNA-binding transcriptional ArsR family regulator